MGICDGELPSAIKPGRARRLLIAPEIVDDLGVCLHVRSDHEYLQVVSTSFEGPRHARTYPHRVKRGQVDQLVIELYASRTGKDDVDLFGLRVPMSERFALPGLDDQVVKTSLLGSQISTSKPRLLIAGQAMLDRHVLNISKVCLPIAHGSKLPGAAVAYAGPDGGKGYACEPALGMAARRIARRAT
jgi:hypothetical protein